MEFTTTDDLLHYAWTIIANVGTVTGEGWDTQGEEWVQAAEIFRDEYHHLLKYQYGG
jgi:hypothetical protein